MSAILVTGANGQVGFELQHSLGVLGNVIALTRADMDLASEIGILAALDEHKPGIIVNPAGYTFTSIALLDALKMFRGPKIELHISNVHARESTYHNSLISRTATGILIGFGANGYELAIDAMARFLAPA